MDTTITPKQAIPIEARPYVVNGDRARCDKLKEWLRENEVRLAEATLADDDRLSHHALAVYPAAKGGCLAYGMGCFAATAAEDPVHVLGDTHGDFDSFLAILEAIRGMEKGNGAAAPIVYLLGDVIDRNGEGCMLECALILAILQKALPEDFAELNAIRIGIIKGDHDIGLLYSEPYAPETRFRAMVSPADYCDWLNQRLEDGKGEDATKIGRAWIRLMKECPAAAFLEATGTLLSHGGVPREDLQKRVAAGEPYMLQSDAFAQDFEWCRMVDVKKKLLNRGSKTSEVGGYEFDSFCKTIFPDEHNDGAPATKVRRFVFGHQHPVQGFEQYIKWYDGYEAICIASFRDDAVFGGPTIPHMVRIAPARAGEGGDEAPNGESVDVYRIELSFEKDGTASDTKSKENPMSDSPQVTTPDVEPEPTDGESGAIAEKSGEGPSGVESSDASEPPSVNAAREDAKSTDVEDGVEPCEGVPLV